MHNIQVKLLDERVAGRLAYESENAAGIDLRACTYSFGGRPFVPISEGFCVKLFPGDRCRIGSGIAIHIGSCLCSFADAVNVSVKQTYAGILLPRSSIGTKFDVQLANTIGLIDADYQGEVVMALRNTGDDIFEIRALDRITQLVIVPIIQADLTIVEEFSNDTARKAGGFGSTGTN